MHKAVHSSSPTSCRSGRASKGMSDMRAQRLICTFTIFSFRHSRDTEEALQMDRELHTPEEGICDRTREERNPHSKNHQDPTLVH